MLGSGRGLVPHVVRLPRIPNDAQWQSFLFLAAASLLRDRLMLALTYYGALRRSELTSQTIGDFDSCTVSSASGQKPPRAGGSELSATALGSARAGGPPYADETERNRSGCPVPFRVRS